MTTTYTSLDAPEEAQSVQIRSPVEVERCQSAPNRKDPAYLPRLAVTLLWEALTDQLHWQYRLGTPGILPGTHNPAFSRPANLLHLHRPSPPHPLL